MSADYFVPGQWPPSRSQTPDVLPALSTPSSLHSTPLSTLVFASPTSSNRSLRRSQLPNISHEYSCTSTETELDDSRLLPIGTPSPTPSPSPSPISDKDRIHRRQVLSSRPRQRIPLLSLYGSRLSLPDTAIDACTDASWTLSSTSSTSILIPQPPTDVSWSSSSLSHPVRHPLLDPFSSNSSGSHVPLPSEPTLEDISATYLLHLEAPTISPLLNSTAAPSVDAFDISALQFAANVMSTWNSEHSGNRYLPTFHPNQQVASYSLESSLADTPSSNPPMPKKVLSRIKKLGSKMKKVFGQPKHPHSGTGHSADLLDHVDVDTISEANFIGRDDDQTPAPTRFQNRRRPSITPETYMPVATRSTELHVSGMLPQEQEQNALRFQEVTERQIAAQRPKTLSEIKAHRRRFSFAALSNITNRAFSATTTNERPRSASALLLHTKHHREGSSDIGRTTPIISSALNPTSGFLQDRPRSHLPDTTSGPLDSDMHRFSLPPLSEFASGLTSRGSWAHYRVGNGGA